MIYLHTYKASFGKSVVTNVSLKFFNDSNGVSRFNMSGRITSTLQNPTVTTSVKFKTSDGAENYDKEILRTTVNYCKVSEGVLGNFLVRYVMDSLKDHSNFTVFCPFYAGFYYAENFPVPSDKFMPFFPSAVKKLDWELTSVYKGKMGKKMIELAKVRVFGVWVFNA